MTHLSTNRILQHKNWTSLLERSQLTEFLQNVYNDSGLVMSAGSWLTILRPKYSSECLNINVKLSVKWDQLNFIHRFLDASLGLVGKYGIWNLFEPFEDGGIWNI